MKYKARGFTACTWMIFLLLAGCAPKDQNQQSGTEPARVGLQPVVIVTYKIPARTTGVLGTTQQIKLSFKTGGIVDRIYVNEGVTVSRGDLLAVLDLAEVEAQVNQARIGLEKAERDLERAGNLYRDSVATLEQYQNARSAFDLAGAQKRIADFNLEHSRIKAPSNGKIQKILVETNEVIGPGHPAILFASTENDWVVRAALTDKDIVRFSIGDTAVVSMDAFPDTKFSAGVSELGSVADPVTGSYEVELRIRNAHPQFRSGFMARVLIYPGQVNRSPAVPVAALLDASDRRADVFIYEGGKALRRSVVTGGIRGDLVLVERGLREGELVIVEGARYLRHGEEVVPVERPENRLP